MNTASPNVQFARAHGVSAEAIAYDATLQRQELPDTGIPMTSDEQCGLLTNYLWELECKRVLGTGRFPTYPMIYDLQNRCSGLPRSLYRVNSKERKDGTPNNNYGRFFFAHKIKHTDAQGNPIRNDKGYPVEDLTQFEWIDQTAFVRSGALKAIAPQLMPLLLETHGLDLRDSAFWPDVNQLCAT